MISEMGYYGNHMANPVTPLETHPEVAKAVGVETILFKREDLHPYGSHKGRSIPVMIDHYAAEGERWFVVSSSGNAGLAAALHVRELNAGPHASDLIKLNIFIGNNAAPHKVDRIKDLEDENIQVILKERPLQAVTMAAHEGACSLRQSMDDEALVGYESLADELAAKKGVGAVFIGTSSGTTAQALAQYFFKKDIPIQVHIVQTSSCHPIADAFESYDGPEEASVANAIIDKTAVRKDVLVPLVEKSGGRGWIVTNDEINGALDLTLEHAGIEISTNSALSVAGAMKAAALGWDFGGAVVCLICGE